MSLRFVAYDNVLNSWSGPGTSYTQRTGHIVDSFEDDKGGDNDALESERCDGRTSTVCDGMGKPRLESGRVVSGLRDYEKYGIQVAGPIRIERLSSSGR